MDQLSLSIDAYTQQGLRRSINQDCIGIGSWRGGAGGGTELSLNYLCEQKSELFLLSDGIGGHDDGEIASRFSVDSIFELFQSQEDFDILTAISITHDKLVNIGLGSLRPLGATLVGLIFTKNLVTIFSLGDSACYHLNGDKLVNLTEDVKSSKPHFNVIEQCLGGGITKPNPSIVKRKFKIGDVFILTSDGVSNWADKEQIKMTIQSKQLSFSRKLCSIAKKSGSNDDLSAVVIKIKSL
ncbi:PP2C family protein-serine/threonine phosphatase [Planktomarina temperata]|mgnify:FL=1|jgi:protein phosphatase|uniref:Serine/threonine protein phosphatase PrpC n=1 Tax=Planktomarina temperata RCA23 TaxID=666509 RepID=A0AAN0VI50_9RHOB|nr:serine/threonine protein phosphatase PrpC [Planktomarina temperata RCA23]